MQIDQEKCIGCEQCIPYCPVYAISLTDSIAQIEFDDCVECSNCLNNSECPTEAILRQELSWPRIIRRIFSDTLATGLSTDLPGRGTDEMKTNDVTGRFKTGYAGIAMEFGRPVLGARIREVEIAAKAVSALGIKFEKLNPATDLMENPETGKFKNEVLDEKVLSIILEFTIELPKLEQLFPVLRKVANEIDTVFSLDLITVVNSDGSIPTQPFINKAGLQIAPNGKTCVGLGRPFKEEK